MHPDRKGQSVLLWMLRDLLRGVWLLVAAFAIGTGAGGGVCLIYDLPLVLSLIGGFLVLAFALVVMFGSGMD